MGIIMIRLQLFYKATVGKELPAFTPDMERLDWLVVNRSSLMNRLLFLQIIFKGKDGITTLKATFGIMNRI